MKRLTPLQRAYCIGYRRALTRMRRELRSLMQGWDAELADLNDVIEGIERDYEHAKAVAKAMAERTAIAEADPEARLH